MVDRADALYSSPIKTSPVLHGTKPVSPRSSCTGRPRFLLPGLVSTVKLRLASHLLGFFRRGIDKLELYIKVFLTCTREKVLPIFGNGFWRALRATTKALREAARLSRTAGGGAVRAEGHVLRPQPPPPPSFES